MSKKKVRRGVELYIDGSQVEGSVKAIKAEMKKLVSKQELMTKGSKEYVEQGKKIRHLKGILNEHRQQLNDINRTQASFLSRGVDMFNKYAASVTAIIAALTGVTLAFRSLRDERNKLEESQAGLKALTGLDDDSISWLTDQAKELSTTMTKEGLRVRQSAGEILDAYMLVGSAKDDLLKNKEALAQVTEESMRLQAAAKEITLNQAVDALTLSLNQYGVGADQATRYTNVLAAGSQAGAANIESLSKSIEKSGTAANDSNVTFEETVGLLEALAYKGIKAEVAGTGLRNFFLKLKKGADDTNPTIVGLETALNNLQSFSAVEIMDFFGLENYTVAANIIRNTDLVHRYTEAVTGTNTAIIQSAINSATQEAKLAQARNEMKLVGIELIERINPAITVSTNLMTNIIRYLPRLIDWFKQYGVTILWLSASVAGYVVALKLVTVWQNRAMIATKLLNAAKVTLSFTVCILKGSLYLLQVAYYGLTGQMAKARGAMVAFNMVTKLNPIGALVTVLVAAAGALLLFTSRTSQAAREQRLLNKLMNEANSSITAQKKEVETYLNIAQDETKSKQQRIEAIQKLNELSPDYLGNLTLEKIGTDEARVAVDSYVQSLLTLARVEAAKNKLIETEQELTALKDKQQAYLDERDSFIGALKNVPRNLGSLWTGGLIENAGEHLVNEITELEEQKIALEKLLAEKIEESITGTPAPTTTGGGGGGNPTGDKDKKDQQVAEEKRYQDELAALKQSYLLSDEMTQEEYNRFLEQLEMQHLSRMLAIAGLEPDARAKIEQRVLDQQIKFKEACAKEEADLYKSSQKEYISSLEKGYQLEVASTTMKYYNGLMTKEEYYEKLLQLEHDYYKNLLADSLVSEEEKLRATQAIGEMEVASAEERKRKLEEIENRKNQVIGAAITGFGDTLGNFFGDSEKSMKEFGKNIILLALDTLEKLVLIGIAERTVSNVTKLGFLGLPKAAAEAALISAAFSAVKGLLSNFYDGGFTGPGEWDKPQGIVHSNEFVANRFAVANPAVRPVLDLLDNAQRNGSIANLSSSDIAAVSGVGSSRSAVTVVNAPAPAADGANNEQFIRALNECSRTMRQVQNRFKDNIKAEVTVTGKKGINQATTDYQRLIKNTRR